MEEQLKLHISWKSEGISIAMLTKILNDFDNINKSLCSNTQSDSCSIIITKVKGGSIVLMLTSLALGATQTPEIFSLFKKLLNKNIQGYNKETLKIVLDFVNNCMINGLSLKMATMGGDGEMLHLYDKFLEAIRSFLKKEIDKI